MKKSDPADNQENSFYQDGSFIFLGYSYDKMVVHLPEEAFDAMKKAPHSGLFVRNYVLDGNQISLSFNQENTPKEGADYWYGVKAEVLPVHEQTDETIGKVTIRQMNEKDEMVKESVATLVELDNSHVMDLVYGEIIRLHQLKFGNGPFARPNPKPTQPQPRKKKSSLTP